MTTPRPIGFHVTMSLQGRRVIAQTPAALRIAARVFLEQGRRRGLLAFRVADTHMHALLRCSRSVAGAFARYVECALGWKLDLGAPFDRAHFEPVFTQSHLVRAFFYVLRQEAHHGTSFDPLHEGSCIPDLLGLRVVDPDLPARVAAALPRLRREELLSVAAFGDPFAPDDAGSEPLHELADATRAAVAGSARAGRVAAVQWAKARGSERAVAGALGIARRSVQRLGTEPADPKIVRAIDGQMRLRRAFRDGSPGGGARIATLETSPVILAPPITVEAPEPRPSHSKGR